MFINEYERVALLNQTNYCKKFNKDDFVKGNDRLEPGFYQYIQFM